MLISIANSNREVFVRQDFSGFGSTSRITRALRTLLDEGVLVKLGYGVYAKAKVSILSGKPIPRVPLEMLVAEYFRQIGVPVIPGKATIDYSQGESDQIPMVLAINTGAKRVSRKICLGARQVKYEKTLRRAS
jgi:hypothetical protein